MSSPFFNYYDCQRLNCRLRRRSLPKSYCQNSQTGQKTSFSATKVPDTSEYSLGNVINVFKGSLALAVDMKCLGVYRCYSFSSRLLRCLSDSTWLRDYGTTVVLCSAPPILFNKLGELQRDRTFSSSIGSHDRSLFLKEVWFTSGK